MKYQLKIEFLLVKISVVVIICFHLKCQEDLDNLEIDFPGSLIDLIATVNVSIVLTCRYFFKKCKI